jgi:hypothetical protein
LALRYCDNITFIRCFFYGPSNTVGNGIAVRPATGNVYFPEYVSFYDCAPVGAYYTDPAWDIWSNAARGRGLVFFGFNEGDNAGQLPSHPGWAGWTGAMVPFGSAGPIDRANTQVTVTGTTAATNLWSYSLPGFMLNTTRRVRLKAFGTYFNNTGATHNIQFFSGFGGQTVFNGTIAAASNASAGTWLIEVDVGARGGSAATQASVARLTLFNAGSVGGVANSVTYDLGAGSNAMTVDTLVAQTWTLVVANGNAAVVTTLDSAVVEIV